MADCQPARPDENARVPLPASVPRSFPTIAYLGSSPGGLFSFEKWQMWRGISEAARDCGFNLIYVAGEEFDYSPQAVLYDLIGKHNVDGIIFWNSFFSQRCSVERTQEYIERYFPLPVASIELALDGCANLMIDNIQGVRDLLDHLIEVHGYRQIAYVNDRNSFTSRSRQQAFEAILTEYGLFNPDLIGSIEELNARGLRPGIDYQAVVAHADYAAVQTMEILQNCGVRVPYDVAVTGFNDGLESRGALSPLTTVRLPFRKLGRRAVETIQNSIRGKASGEQIFLPLQLVLRRSCGCLEPLAEQAAVGPTTTADLTFEELMQECGDRVIAEVAHGMGISVESQAGYWAQNLVSLFICELSRLSNSYAQPSAPDFLNGLNKILSEAVEEGINVSRWHEALSTLRRALRPCLRGRELDVAEDLWQQARVLIGQAAVRAETHRSWKTARRAEILREIESGLLTSIDFQELLKVLAAGLPRLGIRDYFLALYEDQFDAHGWARLILAGQDGHCIQVEPEKQRFHPVDLLPPGWLPEDRPFGLVIEALHEREDQIGYIILKTDPPPDAATCEIFQALRIQLSSALKEVRLRQKLQDALQQAEEANLLKSRFLSMVSHELRTPLNLIVGLSEMAMRQQNRGRKASQDVLRKFNEQIYVSGQHLDRLIRDVLDLASSQAGQMNLICKQLDLIPILGDVVCIGQQLADQKSLDFITEIPDRLPRIWGDKTRLRQIILNLLSNAVKFTAHGGVTLTVQAGTDEILISVTDTGLGIAKEEQERIFDEFHQSDRTSVRGYGGIGLGLAITRRLVELHGGRIWVTSSGLEGSGSKFSFTLPILKECEADDEEFRAIGDGTVLVLTNESGGAQNLTWFLNHRGYAVEELALCEHPNFLEKLIESPPGAVVLDMAPASEQGWEIIKRLKESPKTQDIPVLFYSLVAEKDAGSVFEMDYLTKPVGAEQLVQALKRHGLKSGSQKEGRTILLVDDEPGILDLHARMIQRELPEYILLTAQSGIQGLEIMRAQTPDLVLLDLMMPEMDGFEVLKMMQEEQMLRNIPVIILSAQVLTRRDMARLNQRVAAVLGKGLFTAKETVARIENALARNKRLGSETQRLVHHGMAYIHEHYREPISRADIANHLSVNEQYLSRTFNKEIGIGPMAYLSRYRIQRAKNLLEMGTMSITQVALEVGLSSQSYFSRIFQQETGVSPSAYQRGERPLKF